MTWPKKNHRGVYSENFFIDNFFSSNFDRIYILRDVGKFLNTLIFQGGKMNLVTKDKRIETPVEWAKIYYLSDDFRKDVMAVLTYDNANVKPQEILNLFETFQRTQRKIEIICSYFGRFSRKVLGKTIGDGKAYVNSWRLNRSIWSIAATVAHEVAHVIDGYFPNARFGHGNNSSVGKEMSFPYYIGEQAEKWIKREILREQVMKLTASIESNRGILA